MRPCRLIIGLSVLCAIAFVMGSKFIIYALHHDSSPHVYIGKSCADIKRPAHHGCAANMKRNAQFPVVKWIKSLRDRGEDYDVAVLEEAQQAADLDEAERFHIAYFKSIGIPLLNCTDGGDGALGYRHTEETRKKMSQAKDGWKPSPQQTARFVEMNMGRKGEKHPQFGKPLSPETKAAISSALKGKCKSDETRAKMSAWQIGRKRPPMSDETHAKRSAIRKGKRHTEESKAKMSAASCAEWQRPDAEAKRQRLIARNKDPEFIKKIREAWQRPEVKAKRRASLEATLLRHPEIRERAIATLMRPDVRARAIAGTRAAIQRESTEQRAKRMAAASAYACSPEGRMRAKEQFNDSTFRERHAVALREAMARPGVREVLSEKARLRHSDPAFAERHRAVMREVMARPEVRARIAALRARLRDKVLMLIALASPPIRTKNAVMKMTGMNFKVLTAIWDQLLADSAIMQDETGVYRVAARSDDA